VWKYSYCCCRYDEDDKEQLSQRRHGLDHDDYDDDAPENKQNNIQNYRFQIGNL
jgi:hypothetical protein